MLTCIIFFALHCIAAPMAAVVPDQYVATMTAGMAEDLFKGTLDHVRSVLGPNDKLGETWSFFNFRGFALTASGSTVNLIRQIPGINLLHEDYVHYANEEGYQINTTDPTGYALDRISHRTRYQLRSDGPDHILNYPSGQSQTIYVLDSGIRSTHVDFGGRVTQGPNYAPDNVNNGHAARDRTDYANHGTPVAGLAAGTLYGAAPRANLVDVRILNDNNSGTYSSEISGINYAVNNAQSLGIVQDSLINFSVGGPDNDPEDNNLKYAVREAINNGMFIAIAAGNSRMNAAYFEPANVPEACTIGGTDALDREYYSTNYGAAVDLFAPGNNITAPSSETDYSVKQVYGTSFACPLVAGVAALWKSFGSAYTNYSPQELCTELAERGTQNHIRFTSIPNNDFGGPNIILWDLGADY